MYDLTIKLLIFPIIPILVVCTMIFAEEYKQDRVNRLISEGYTYQCKDFGNPMVVSGKMCGYYK